MSKSVADPPDRSDKVYDEMVKAVAYIVLWFMLRYQRAASTSKVELWVLCHGQRLPEGSTFVSSILFLICSTKCVFACGRRGPRPEVFFA